MSILRGSRINTRFAALVLVFLVSFSLYGLYCVNTVSEVKINGPYYKRIIQSKDVIADILPPPEYLIEAYLVIHQMLNAGTGAELGALEAKLRGLRDQYEARHALWARELPEDSLRQALVVDSYTPVQRMLEAVDREFLPALRAADPDRARTALELVIGREYARHRAAIDRAVELAVKRHREDEARAAVAVQSRTYGQIVLGVLLFLALSGFSSWVLRKGEAGPDAANFRPRPESDHRLTPG